MSFFHMSICYVQVLVGEQCYGLWRKTPLSAQAEELVSRSISRAKLAKFGFKHVALPSELLSRTERERISRYANSSLLLYVDMTIYGVVRGPEDRVAL